MAQISGEAPDVKVWVNSHLISQAPCPYTILSPACLARMARDPD
jgi:hypothetical protein